MDYNIGARIKELRKARKLTLKDVARETRFSPGLISQIENNITSPPIATLSKIARFFDVKMGIFFEGDEDEVKYEVMRRGEQGVASRFVSRAEAGRAYTYEAFPFRKRNKKMQPFLLAVSNRDSKTLSGHGGEKFLLILKGEAVLVLEDEQLILKEGDAVYFCATLEGRLLGLGGGEVRVLVVVTH